MSLEKNTVVWASAGTGKTRKLVEVYLELLDRGVDPLRIVAVTFTEKAAAEMRDRIRHAVYERLEKQPADTKSAWMRTLAVLPAAPISTIHGFCGILLRDHGMHMGIDPSFSILDEQRSLDLAREAARETIRHEIRTGNADAEALFGDFGLEKLVETIVSAGYWLNSLGENTAWLESRIERQREAARILEAELAEQIQKYGGDFGRIGDLADELDAKRARHPLRKRDDPAALLPRIGQIAGVSVAAQLTQLIAQSAERFRMKKLDANALDFDDLLLGARDLLRARKDIREHYKNHFAALLVDEFQDTDHVQADIIALLAEHPDDSSRLATGKLMIVGDPKQSIYRFRRARVTVFFDMLRRIIDEGGTLEHLQDNYRSAAPIAEFSNRLSEMMMDGMGKNLRDGGRILNPKNSPPSPNLSYRIRFSPADQLKPKSDASFLGITYVAAETEARAATGREMEAEALARLLKKWKSQGTIESWREVAILLRAMSNIEVYLGALESHGIPVYVVQGTAFYQKSEVSDLIAFLELVLHPDDPLLRATVLTSSLFGITYRELIDGDFICEQCDEILKPWVEKRDRATAAEILQDVIRRTNFDVVMMAQKNGPQRVANIGKLIEVTRELARQGTTALDDVVRHLRDRAHDTTVREPEAQIVGQEDDVVRVLTVHQAKGLEFDIVIVPGLAARTGRGTSDRIFFSDRWGLLAGAAYGLHRKVLPHALILQAKEEDEDQQYEEEKRLLYVAVTRAKKMLVLGEGFSNHTGPWLQWVEKLFESVQPGAIEKARSGAGVKVRFRGFSVQVVPASKLNIPEQLSFAADSIVVGEPDISILRTPRAMPVLEMTPSDLSALDGCFRFFHWTRLLGLAEPGTESTGDTPNMRLGSLAHRLLETGSVPSAAALADSGLPDLAAVFESSEWRELSQSSPEREMPFIMHLSVGGRDCWIRGRMDAVVPGDPPRVIDYKYAMWRESGDASYEIQMTAYCLALMKAFGVDLATAELWYLRQPMKVLRREYAREESERRLSDLISKYVAALETGSWPMAQRDYCDRIECGFRERCWTLRG
ncbi:MAG: UvrD-helicase domain-containing protein [Acidobacteria bacterium]|nr:UvrD-helicase domain-containing protein [Acidobacteriota bacterium]